MTDTDLPPCAICKTTPTLLEDGSLLHEDLMDLPEDTFCPLMRDVFTREEWIRLHAPAQVERLKEISEKYSDLLYQVAKKIPGETRHETARRIINQHETRGDHGPQIGAKAND